MTTEEFNDFKKDLWYRMIFKNRPERDEKRYTLTLTDEQYVKLKESAWFRSVFDDP